MRTAKLPCEQRHRNPDRTNVNYSAHIQTGRYIQYMQVRAGHHSVSNGRKSPGDMRQRVGTPWVTSAHKVTASVIRSAESQMLIFFGDLWRRRRWVGRDDVSGIAATGGNVSIRTPRGIHKISWSACFECTYFVHQSWLVAQTVFHSRLDRDTRRGDIVILKEYGRTPLNILRPRHSNPLEQAASVLSVSHRPGASVAIFHAPN